MSGNTAPEKDILQGNHASTVVVYESSSLMKPAAPPKTQEFSWEVADLGLVEIATGKLERLTRGLKPEWHAFSPNGTAVAFVSRKERERAGSGQALFDLFLVLLPSGIVRPVAQNIRFALATSVSWSPNGKFLGFIENGTTGQGNCFVVSLPDGRSRKATEREHPPFNDARPHSFSLRPPIWDASGQNIYAFAGNALWRISLASGNATEVARIPIPRIPIEIIGARRGTFWSPDGGRSLYVITRNEDTRQYGIGKIDLMTGTYGQMLEENKTYAAETPLYSIDISADGRKVVYPAEDSQHPPDIWIAGIDFKNPRRLTRINSQFDSYDMGESRLIEWRSLDGERLHGALILPTHYQNDKKYPLIVWPYPGDTKSVGVNLFGGHRVGINGTENAQVLATRGYAVLLPDTPAEVGPEYVKKFIHAVMPGVDRVVEMGIADPERIGLIGHSNGGYGVLALITHTNRFKAAVSRAGFANLFSYYCQMKRDGAAFAVGDVEQGRMGGSPWQYRDRYIENSPMFYLDSVQTPLLLIHGSLDEAVSSSIADEAFVGLRRLGKEVVFAKYEGEGHWEGRWSHANQIDYWNRVIDWFDVHLRLGKSENREIPMKE
jgi:dipeptidyl aminopeptidase/acylaminoacyl peptidase